MALLNGKHTRLERYIREIADQMGLRDWELEISTSDEMSDHTGYCSVYYGRKRAQIIIAEDWPSWKPKGLRNTVVHELIHCHTQFMGNPLRATANSVGQLVFQELEREYRHHHEIAVDGMAVAWAGKFPLPEKAKKETRQ